MALETLTLTPPTGSAIALNDGTKWGLETLELGNPERREDLIASLDADGAVPARVSPKGTREVTARVRLLDAASMNAALNSVAAVEKVLESAERLAAGDWTNPVTDLVRLVYTPAGATQTYSLIVLTAEITDLPKTLDGEGAGWFIRRPVVNLRFVCDPFAYGTTGSTPFTTTYLDTTTSGTPFAAVATVAGGAGEVSPWLRLKLKDVASPSRVRSRVIVGVKEGEASTAANVATSAMTLVAGSLSSGVITTTSANWTVAASLPSQTRTGNFKVYLSEATSSSASGGSVRLTWAESGGSRRTNPSAGVTNAGVTDAYLGEIVAGNAWGGWIEVTGTVSFKDLVLVPSDSVVEITGPATGKQLNGAVTVADTLASVSASINARTLTTGSGSWSYGGTGWSVDPDGALRTAVSNATPVIALAGTTNPIELDLRWTSATTRTSFATLGTGGLVTGAIARYVDSNNFVWAGFVNDGTGVHNNARPYIQKRIGGTYQTLWAGEVIPSALGGLPFDWRIQITADGRWYIEVGFAGGPATQFAAGQDADLTSGGTLGNTSNARVGLIDQYVPATPFMTRYLRNFRVSSLVGVTPPPIPAGDTLTLSGPKMVNASGAEYPYIGSSGIRIRPGVNNNLTVMARRSAGLLSAGNGVTDALDIDIDGYPRFLSVPNA